MFKCRLFILFSLLSFLLFLLFLLLFKGLFHFIVKFKSFFVFLILKFCGIWTMIRVWFESWFVRLFSMFGYFFFTLIIPLSSLQNIILFELLIFFSNFIFHVFLIVKITLHLFIITLDFFIIFTFLFNIFNRFFIFTIFLMSLIDLFLFILLDSKFFHQQCYFSFNVNSHWNDRMVLNVRNFKLFYWNHDCEIRLQKFFINFQQVVFLIKLQILEQLNYPFELLCNVLLW